CRRGAAGSARSSRARRQYRPRRRQRRGGNRSSAVARDRGATFVYGGRAEFSADGRCQESGNGAGCARIDNYGSGAAVSSWLRGSRRYCRGVEYGPGHAGVVVGAGPYRVPCRYEARQGAVAIGMRPKSKMGNVERGNRSMDESRDESAQAALTPAVRTLATDEICKAYGGRQVVRGVSMQIAQGEVVGLLGPNGAGKTTCFYMIVGLVRPDAGRVLADGEEITRLPMYLRARQHGISYLPQEPSVFRKLTVQDNILAVLEAQELSWESRRTRTERLIEQLNLGHVRKTLGYALSGGERRRVEIARCLAIEPAFILLDEPFSGIDPIAVLELQEIIFDLKMNGIGVLITDHNVRETLSVTDRAYIISDGKILFAGTPGDLGRNSEVRRIYLGEKF